jgi:hypothetical protein
MKKIIITQSNYIPWKGYFDGMALVDELVIYDDMQYTKRDWRNRNLIKTAQGLKWLSIPVEVKGKYFQKINETRISDKYWIEDHLNQLKQNYKQANCYNSVFPWIEELYLNCKFDLLTEVNHYFLEEINKYLNIDVKILRSESFALAEDRTERLLNICIERGATDYYTGLAAKAYLDEEMFDNSGVKVHYFDYSGYPIYVQLHGDFEHGVSILDLLLNMGKASPQFMKN